MEDAATSRGSAHGAKLICGGYFAAAEAAVWFAAALAVSSDNAWRFAAVGAVLGVPFPFIVAYGWD